MEKTKIDKENIWHPYTSMNNPLPTYEVVKAEGCKLFTKNHGTLIDGMSSWWAVVHGYNHPVLNKAIEEQTKQMSHVMFGGLTHEPAIRLTKKLLEIAPKGINKFFFSDSGSVSVEVAMKMALQYHHAKGNAQKNKFLALRGAYHGDTWHAMSVCDPVTGMHGLFAERLPKQLFISKPAIKFDEEFKPSALDELRETIENHRHELAAFILEPIVQGAGGMYFYHPEFLKQAKKLCEANDILLIADEIATGFGRTGKLFACEHAGISPDILCLGKSITGGYMSFAVTGATENVANTISSGNPGVFMHGPTFMGNPLACAVCSASIDLLLSSNWEDKVKHIESRLKNLLQEAKNYEKVEDVRVLGAIGVVVMKNPVRMEEIQAEFVKHGIWVRPFGKLVYLMPPYIISDSELDFLCENMLKVVREHV